MALIKVRSSWDCTTTTTTTTTSGDGGSFPVIVVRLGDADGGVVFQPRTTIGGWC